MWRKSFLQCGNRAKLKRRVFHMIGGIQKGAFELLSWLGDRPAHHGEEKSVSQRHGVPVWHSGQPKKGRHRGPTQLHRQSRLCVSQVGTSRVSPWWPQPPDRCSLESSVLIPGGRNRPRGRRRHSLGIWASAFEGGYIAKKVTCWANQTITTIKGK